MKSKIHPNWNPKTKVTCACGNSFYVGSTQEEMRVEVCYACHPFYTGQMKYVDTAGRVDSFLAKQSKAKEKVLSKSEKRKIKKEKKVLREMEKPETLEEIRRQTLHK